MAAEAFMCVFVLHASIKLHTLKVDLHSVVWQDIYVICKSRAIRPIQAVRK